MNDDDKGPVPKNIHQFYFVKFRLYGDPELKATIEKAEKLIQKKNGDLFRSSENIDEVKFKRHALNNELKFQSESRIRNKHEVEFWQCRLDKLSCGKSTNQGRAVVNSTDDVLPCKATSVKEHNDLTQSFHYRMLHKSKSLVEEKKLLREIKQLEGRREKVVANAATQAKNWVSLGSEEAKPGPIKLTYNHLDRLKEEEMDVKGKIKLLEKAMEAVEKDLSYLQKQLAKLYQEKGKVNAGILYMRKQHDEVNACFYQYLSVMKNATEYARNKDVAALKELSAREVEKFMSQWSSCQAFRDDYQKRIASGQLNRDGKMQNRIKWSSIS